MAKKTTKKKSKKISRKKKSSGKKKIPKKIEEEEDFDLDIEEEEEDIEEDLDEIEDSMLADGNDEEVRSTDSIKEMMWAVDCPGCNGDKLGCKVKQDFGCPPGKG